MQTPEGSHGRGPDEERIFLERLAQISRRGAKDERFRILDEIAQGGMGRVLRVYDEDLRRELAMKVIRLSAVPAGSSSGRADARENLTLFLEEVQITGQLNHQSVVPVHDIGVNARGELYYLMPLLRGIDLRVGIERMQRHEEGWTLPRIVEVIYRTAQAVEHAHQRGVVHRDLKPANVMIGELGEIWVLDWGLAQLQRVPLEGATTEIDSETHLLLRAGGMVGTPGYMAPEQADSEGVPTGPRSDVYALGAILYHVLAGEMPYASPPPSCAADTIVQRMLNGPPRQVLECAPDAQPELVAICEKAMQRDLQQRYPSALAMALDLRAWLEGRVVSTYDVGMLGTYRKWRRRNRATARAVDALAGLALVATIALYVQARFKVRDVEAANVREQRANNAANLRAADLSIEGRDSREAVRLLDRCPVPQRGWEWRWLRSRADTSSAVLKGHADVVKGVSTDASGTRAVSWDADGGLWTWDLPAGTGRPVECPAVPRNSHSSPTAIDPTGQVLATSPRPGQLCLIEYATHAVRREFATRTNDVRALTWSFDGKWIACADRQGLIEILNPADGEAAGAPLRWTATEGFEARALCFSPDGALIACVSSDAPVQLFAWQSEPGLGPRAIGTEGAYGACFSPDGRQLLVAGRDRSARLYDIASGSLIRRFDGHDAEVRSALFMRDGRHVVTANSDGSLCVWSLKEDEPKAVLIGHTGAVHGLATAASADEVLSCSTDHSLRLWSLRQPELANRTLHRPPLLAMAALPTSGSLRGITLDGAVVALEDDPSTPVPEMGPALDARCAKIDTGTGRVLIGDGHGALISKQLLDGKTEWSRQVFTTPVTAVCLDGDGLCTAGAAEDGALVVLERKSGKPLLELAGPAPRITALAFSPRAPWLALVREHGGLTLIEPFEGGRSRWLGLADREIRALAWCMDGKRVAVGSTNGHIAIVDPEAQEPPLELVGHGGMIKELQFQADGSRLYSTSLDGTLRVWDPQYPAPLLTLGGDSNQMFGPLALDLARERIAAATYKRGVEGTLPLAIWMAPIAR